MNFFMDFEPAIKNTSGEVGGTIPNYFSMIEDLQKHVSLVTSQKMQQSFTAIVP